AGPGEVLPDHPADGGMQVAGMAGIPIGLVPREPCDDSGLRLLQVNVGELLPRLCHEDGAELLRDVLEVRPPTHAILAGRPAKGLRSPDVIASSHVAIGVDTGAEHAELLRDLSDG